MKEGKKRRILAFPHLQYLVSTILLIQACQAIFPTLQPCTQIFRDGLPHFEKGGLQLALELLELVMKPLTLGFVFCLLLLLSGVCHLSQLEQSFPLPLHRL